ncbi:MAG: O-antigen ligase family protein [Candidatus Eremiobacteraeota bacterium]|nr:O-antigen ligase family protein [Candidatus Eremiobacteraeota bacterium]
MSTLGNPTYLGGYLATMVPIPLFLYLREYFRQSSRMPDHRPAEVEKYAYLAIWLICVAALYLTYSRGAWLACLVSHMLFFLILWKELGRFKKQLAVIVLLLLFMAMGCLVYERKKGNEFSFSKRVLRKYIQWPLGYTGGREHLWRMAGQIFRDHLLLGSGPGTFSYAYLRYRGSESLAMRSRELFMGSCHNEFLEAASSTGILGFISFFAIAAAFIYCLARKIRETDSEIRLKWIAILSCGAGYLVHIFFLFPTVSTALYWYFFIALIGIEYTKELSVSPVKGKKNRGTDNTGKRKLFHGVVVIIIAIFSIVLFIQSVRIAMASYFVCVAKHCEKVKRPDIAQEFYRKALLYNPGESSYYLYRGKALEQLYEKGMLDEKLKMEIIQSYKSAIQRDPWDPSACAHLANFYAMLVGQGDVGYSLAAEDYYRKALERSPYNYNYYGELGKLYGTLGDYDKAKECFHKGLDIYPRAYDIYYNIAVVNMRMGDSVSARENLEKALEIYPEHELSQALMKKIAPDNKQ